MINLKSIRNSMRIAAGLMTLVITIGAGTAFAHINIDGCNDTTGPNSENENEWDINDDFDIDIENLAEANNDIWFDVNSGYNDIFNNTEVCDVLTGDILGDFQIINDLNSGDMDLDFIEFGDIDISLGNSLTGPFSDNSNEVNIDRDFDIDVDNIADIDNDLNYDLNTGNNDISNNTSVGFVETGDIEVKTKIENIGNCGAGGCIDLPVFGNTDIDANFSNELTGPNSENENTLNIDTDFDFDLENNVDINNNIDFNANTGNNDIGCNTVVDGIRTGDIKVRFDILNSANSF